MADLEYCSMLEGLCPEDTKGEPTYCNYYCELYKVYNEFKERSEQISSNCEEDNSIDYDDTMCWDCQCRSCTNSKCSNCSDCKKGSNYVAFGCDSIEAKEDYDEQSNS